ncbi:MAG: MamI family restriction endonuclease [Candidatus Pacebacteria bacterium]|nr:MamI family restriction endonuclease [Candidatus Paceibacterota bacterium]
MRPNTKLVTLHDNIKQIVNLLGELVLQPRINAIKWSRITKQTPNIKIGYPGQHLASLITGMTGERSGARGNDIADGSEVKSCSRIDQLDKCNSCELPVARLENKCSGCGSSDIKRNNDSKWLFSIRNQAELALLTKKVPRIVLIIGDYPNFEKNDFSTLRFQAFEIWPTSPRQKVFSEIMTNYYEKIYLGHKKANQSSNPAPKNFWPYQYQFYICNPIQTFSCIVEKSDSSPKITIENYVKPSADRSKMSSVLMPTEILKEGEIDIILKKVPEVLLKRYLAGFVGKKQALSLSFKDKAKLFANGINEELRAVLPLRDTDKISTAKTSYSRRGLK